MRLGFSLGSLLSVEEIFDCAKILSKYHADSIWIPETWGMDCCSVLSHVSGIANEPKLGSSIINIYSRSPALAAMSAVTLDVISNGRFMLGLGTSSKPIVEDWHGIKFENPLHRMREYVDVIRLVMSGKKVSYDGKFFHLKNFGLLIKPRRTKIPIYLAAINPEMVKLTWDIADGVIFYLRPLHELKGTIEMMQSKRKIDVACQLITCVSNDYEKSITRAKKTIAFYVSVGTAYRQFLASHGFKKATDAIFEEYKKNGLNGNHVFVTDDMVNSLSICGTPEDVRRKMFQFVETGIDLPILQFNPVENVKESFELLVKTLARDMQ
ncbi:MAG: LLM class flavin-dependent oxidoreductase [Thaumarchaeota archaeon]|nr:LLM class flavin-dependent oxidoreductase [Nitrososphaerota archaeon]MDE1840680.1 LLM class flavin-dependent oxidoreductase [Nitrososphaerota archaeon]MDE1877889.1 LLM class flavin-dependent oxidoreductase [Nitrososphaerota archaeon]